MAFKVGRGRVNFSRETAPARAARRQGWPVGVPSRVVQGRCRAQAGSDGSYVFLSTSSAPSPPPGARLEGAGLADHPGLAGWAAPAAGERVRRCPARAGRCFCTIASIRIDAIVQKHLPALAGHRRTLSPAAGAAQPASPGWSANPAPSRRAPGGGEGAELVDRNTYEPSEPAWARQRPCTTREGTPTGQPWRRAARAGAVSREKFTLPRPTLKAKPRPPIDRG